MIHQEETNITDQFDSVSPNGGDKENWQKVLANMRKPTFEQHIPLVVEERVKQNYELKTQNNVEEPLDDSGLIVPLHIDRALYETQEELFKAVVGWWVNLKQRSPKTVNGRMNYARVMSNHPVYPVNWLKFDRVQILNQLLYLQIYHYPEKAKETGNPNYGVFQLSNLWKTVGTFAQAYGINIKNWGYSPPAGPEPQVKIVPRPATVNKLIHYKYPCDKYTRALLRTLLTLGFQTGVRPEELITLKMNDIFFSEGYIFITEQKKKFRERQIWLEPPVMYSHQQNSLKNWVEIWRPQKATKNSGNYLFIKQDGTPFPSEDALRRFLSRYCKPVWPYFKPKIMRDWSAIGRLIRTKIETKKWDVWQVKNALGHAKVSTTEEYIRFAEDYYRHDCYDWLRAVLKYHPNSKRMKCLVVQEHRSGQEVPEVLNSAPKSTNGKKGAPENRVSPVGKNGPGGIRTRDL